MSNNPTNQPKPRSASGCRWGCLLAVCVFVVIVGAIVWGAISTYQGAYLMTSATPRTFEPVAGPGDAETVAARLQSAQEKLGKGEPAEVRLTADDLNAWFLGNPSNRELAEHLRFRIEEDWLVAEVSVPLVFMSQLPLLPSFHDRFFNGKLAARLSVSNRELTVETFDLVGNGKRLPWLFTSKTYHDSVAEIIKKALKDDFPEDQSLIQGIESIQIANNEIVMKFAKSELKPANGK